MPRNKIEAMQMEKHMGGMGRIQRTEDLTLWFFLGLILAILGAFCLVRVEPGDLARFSATFAPLLAAWPSSSSGGT